MQNYGNFYSEPRETTGGGFNPYDRDEDLIDDLGCDDLHDQEFEDGHGEEEELVRSSNLKFRN